MTSPNGVALPPRWEISSRLMACWPIDGEHTLELEPAERTPDDRIRWTYRLARDGQTIFEESDVRSGVGAELTTDAYAEAAKAVLNFLITVPGEPDGLTATQREWTEIHASDLEIFTLEDLCGYCGADDHLSPSCPRP